MQEQGDHRLGGDLRERLRDRVRSVHLVSFSWPGPQRPIKKLIFFFWSSPWQEASRRRGCHQRRRRGDWRRGGDQRVRFAPSVSFCFASCLTRAACLPYLTLQEGQRRRGGGQRQRRGNRVCTHFSGIGYAHTFLSPGTASNLIFYFCHLGRKAPGGGNATNGQGVATGEGPATNGSAPTNGYH